MSDIIYPVDYIVGTSRYKGKPAWMTKYRANEPPSAQPFANFEGIDNQPLFWDCVQRLEKSIQNYQSVAVEKVTEVCRLKQELYDTRAFLSQSQEHYKRLKIENKELKEKIWKLNQDLEDQTQKLRRTETLARHNYSPPATPLSPPSSPISPNSYITINSSDSDKDMKSSQEF